MGEIVNGSRKIIGWGLITWFFIFLFAPLPPDFLTQGFYASCGVVIYAVLFVVIKKFFPRLGDVRNGFWLVIGSSVFAFGIISIAGLVV